MRKYNNNINNNKNNNNINYNKNNNNDKNNNNNKNNNNIPKPNIENNTTKQKIILSNNKMVAFYNVDNVDNVDNVNNVNNVNNIDNTNSINLSKPHKLGKKPNSIKKFEENLKKKADEEKNKREKKQKLDTNDKIIISKNNNESITYKKNNNNQENNTINNVKNNVKNITDDNLAKNKKTENKNNTNTNTNNTNANNTNTNSNNTNANNTNANNTNANNTDVNNTNANENIKNNTNNNDIKSFDDIKLFNDLLEQNDNNDDNYDYDDDNVRSPIPSKINCLTDNIVIDDEFSKFKQNIIHDETIDEDMKEIIIMSRLEFIGDHENKIKENAEKTNRINLIIPLKIKLYEDDSNFNKIAYDKKEKIINLIDKWINKKINHIELESESLYYLYELIDLMGIEKKITNIQEVKNIFFPSDPDDFIDFVEIINLIKTQLITEENNRIIKELELKEFEIFKIKEIESRQNNIKLLELNLTKISIFDSRIKNLKEKLDEPIKKYYDLEIDKIILSNDIYEETIKFINSIRINHQNRELIIKLFELSNEQIIS